MNKYRTYGFWISLLGAVLLFLQVLGQMCGFTIDNERISAIVTAFCGILVVLGVLIKNDESDSSDDDSDSMIEDSNDAIESSDTTTSGTDDNSDENDDIM